MRRLSLLLLTSLTVLAGTAQAEIIERIIAKVNGEIITLSEFQERQLAAAQAERITPEQIGTFLRQNNARLLQEAIDDILLIQKAEDAGLQLPPEYVDEVIESIKKDNGITEWNEITFRNFGVHPQNSDIVFAGAEITTGIMGPEFDKAKGKIYKTEDGGENWNCVWEGDSLARFVLFDPTNPDTLYASTGIFDRDAYNDTGEGVLKSTDGGETWQQINNGLDNLFAGFLEMHPEDSQTLFVAAGNNTHWQDFYK